MISGLTLSEAKFVQEVLRNYEPQNLTEADLQTSLTQQLEAYVGKFVNEHDTLMLWCDGAARPHNPGPAGAGVVGKVNDRIVFEISEHLGKKTNNYAEYRAAILGLRRAIDIGARHVLLHTDSKLVVEQFYGRWRCREQSLVPLLGRLKGLSTRFDSCRLKWIPREENREADGLSVAGAYPPREDKEAE